MGTTARLQSAIATSQTETPAGTWGNKEAELPSIRRGLCVSVPLTTETKDSLRFFPRAIICSYSSLTHISFSSHRSE